LITKEFNESVLKIEYGNLSIRSRQGSEYSIFYSSNPLAKFEEQSCKEISRRTFEYSRDGRKIK
jgi:hypothetical protein